MENSAIKKVVFEKTTGDYTRTAIPANACINAINLTEVVIPDTVKSIGADAFHGCISLTEINLPDSLTSLGTSSLADTGLNELTIPARVSSFGNNTYPVLNNSTVKKVIFAKTSGEYTRTVIQDYACKGAVNLTEAVIPDTVTKIGNNAFDGCASLSAIDLPDALTVIQDHAFRKAGLTELIIPAGVTTFGNANWPSFENSEIKKVVFEKTTGEYTRIAIPANVCTGAKKLTEVVIPDTVKSIGADAFHGCFSLTEINLPDSLTSLGTSSLADTGLNELTIPAGVSSFGNLNYPVLNNSAVKKVIFAKTSGEYTRSAIQDYACKGAVNLKEVVIPDTVTRLGNNAFDGCVSLTAIDLPDALTFIQDHAFRNTGLTGLTIPAGVTTIGHKKYPTFENCDLTEIVFAETSGEYTRTAIPAYACRNAVNLTGVSIPGTVTQIGEEAFSDTAVETVCFDGTADAWTLLQSNSGAVLANAEVYFEHNYQDVETMPPTCTSEGMLTSICTRCGKTNGTTPVAVKEHNIVLQPGRESSETENGYREYYMCSDCGTFFEDAVGNTPIADIEEWKTDVNGGFIPMTGEEKNVTIWDVIQAVINLITYFVSVIGRLINK